MGFQLIEQDTLLNGSHKLDLDVFLLAQGLQVVGYLLEDIPNIAELSFTQFDFILVSEYLKKVTGVDKCIQDVAMQLIDTLSY